MPFYMFRKTTLDATPTNANKVPVFLVPSLLGIGNVELDNLARTIFESSGGETPVYIYNEPEDEHGNVIQMSLEEHAAAVAEEIREKMRKSPVPYILAGYSYGAILAEKTAIDLASTGHNPHLYLIDQPELATSQEYLQNPENAISVTRDLIKVANVAAQVAGLKAVDVTQSEIEKLSHYMPGEVLNQLMSKVILNYGEAGKEVLTALQYPDRAGRNVNEDLLSKMLSFSFYLETSKRNLYNLAYADPADTARLDHVNVILTKETAMKYGETEKSWQQYKGGWGRVSDSVALLENKDVQKASHLELLTEDIAPIIGRLISEQIQNTIKPSDLVTSLLYGVLTKASELQPHGNGLDQILQNLGMANQSIPRKTQQRVSVSNNTFSSPVRFFQQFGSPQHRQVVTSVDQLVATAKNVPEVNITDSQAQVLRAGVGARRR